MSQETMRRARTGRSLPRGEAWLGWLGVAALPLGILAVGVFGYWLMLYLKDPPPPRPADPAAPLVRVEKLSAAQPFFEIRVDGTVVPKHEVSLASEVSGRVLSIGRDINTVETVEPLTDTPGAAPTDNTSATGAPAAEIKEAAPPRRGGSTLRAGNYVRAGEIIARIDPATYQLEVQRLDAELEQSATDSQQLAIEKENTEALRKIADKEFKLADADYQRLAALFQQGRITEAQKDESERQVERARNALKTLDNVLALIPKRGERLAAQERLVRRRRDLAELDLKRTRVVAPISGVVSQLAVEENDFVQRGVPLAKIVDPTVLEVKCQLRSDDLYWLWSATPNEAQGSPPAAASPQSGRPYYEIPHAKAKVIYTIAGRSYVWQGQPDGRDTPFLSRFEGAGLDDRTRTVPCRVEIPNPRRPNGDGPRMLVPGMFVEVVLEVRPQVPLLGIPERALHAGSQVYTVASGKLRIHRGVQVVRVIDGVAWARLDPASTLAPGQDLIVSSLPQPIDGMDVSISADTRDSGSALRAGN